MNKFLKNMKTKNKVVNYMGGVSYTLNPLDTLKMITASSIFGEPAYYRNGEFEKRIIKDGIFHVDRLFADYSVTTDRFDKLKTSEIMEQVIDEALDYDYASTLNWAVTLRKDYLMRLNPQVIMVRAATHSKRKIFTKENPGEFARLNNLVMSRADEPATQLTYWLYKNGEKNNLPNVLKRSWAKKLSSLSRYELYKYKNSGLGIIDTVRICHAKGADIDELMKTGNVTVTADTTWENLRSNGKGWKEIAGQIDIPHMALLRNLRGIFEETNDAGFCIKLLQKLIDGVARGKQYPFRYWAALKAVEQSEAHHKTRIINALETCMDRALEALPFLKGKTMCLSDNSGSAWGSFNSEYGSVTVAEIDNLSSVITAVNSDEGYVGKFGDKLIVTPVVKRRGILEQTEKITRKKSNDVGGSTENGIWLFFDNAISKREHWDNIFIYSDQQAGHGGLYGTKEELKRYAEKGYAAGHYIDVAKLIGDYRKTVNPKVNVFSVQTAGYNNVVIPEYGYRTNILYGWTGKELQFASTMIDFWDQIDKK